MLSRREGEGIADGVDVFGLLDVAVEDADDVL